VFNYVVMSNNTVYKYDSDWNYIGHIDGGTSSNDGGGGDSGGYFSGSVIGPGAFYSGPAGTAVGTLIQMKLF
jgi:hypothetical protein